MNSAKNKSQIYFSKNILTSLFRLNINNLHVKVYKRMAPRVLH